MSDRRIKVLLVDDHSIIRHGMRMAIATVEGIEVTGEAASGIEALHLVQKNRYDIALLDIRMPDIDAQSASRICLCRVGTQEWGCRIPQ